MNNTYSAFPAQHQDGLYSKKVKRSVPQWLSGICILSRNKVVLSLGEKAEPKDLAVRLIHCDLALVSPIAYELMHEIPWELLWL